MTSMIHSRAFNPVLYQKIRVCTDLYGVKCRVYVPTLIPPAFMNYSDIQYNIDTFIEQKLLIPKAVIYRNKNPNTMMGFSEEEQEIWATVQIPRYSKIVVAEANETLAFIISEIETTQDSRLAVDRIIAPETVQMYFKYTLVASGAITQSDTDIQATIDAQEETLMNDPIKGPAMSDMTRVSPNLPNPAIQVGKL